MPGPLTGLSVLELGGIGPAPHAGMVMADLGADVVQVGRPAMPGLSPATDVLNRGKRSVAIDIKQPQGAGLILRLVARSDVLIEGFRPGVTERLGLGPDACLGANPRLVYGRVTGWGQEGPLAQAAGHDIDYLAVSGVLDSIGTPSESVPPLNLVADFGGGSMLLVVGVLAALLEVGRTDRGQVVDAAMVDGAALLMAMHHGGLAGGWWESGRSVNLFDGAAPFYAVYPTADGGQMAVGALEPQFFHALLGVLGLDPAELPAQMDRSGWPEMRRRFAEVFSTRTRAEWEEAFAGVDACVVGVYSMAEAPDHPQLQARQTFRLKDGIRQPAPAPRFSSTPTMEVGPIPVPGADTESVLASLGIEAEAISRLRRAGTVG